MAYEFHYTPTGTGVISGKEVLEQTEDAINDLSGQISGDVQIAIDTANNALNTANTASADAQNAVNTASTAYTAATNAQNTANAAQNTANNALTAAQNAQNDVNALGNRVTTAEGNITQNTNAITGLTTRMGTAEGNIGNLQTAVSTAQATANSAQQTATTARQQSYVFRYSSTALTPSSTNSNTLLDNTDNLKVGDKVIDSSGVLFSITAIDTQNSTFTIGTALVDLAVDSSVMHLSGNETAAGDKTFSNKTTFNNGVFFTNSLVTKGTIPQTSVSPYRIYFGSGTNYGASLFNIDTGVESTGVQSLIFRSAENVVGGDDARMYLVYNPNRIQPRYLSLKGGIEPNTNNTYECGTSSNKWKTFNGINPGALSMPDLNNGIDISGYITVVNNANKESLYTPPANGWISVALTRTSGQMAVMLKQGNITSSGQRIDQENGTQTCNAMLPVKGGVQVSINSALADGIEFAYFYPCLGNV